MSNTTPIVCTLTPGELRDRVAWITSLNRRALLSHRVRGRTLELTYARDAADDVRELVRREEKCCAFLRFAVREEADAVRLKIEVPRRARDGVDALVAPFLPGSNGRLARSAVGSTVVIAVACIVACAVPLLLPAVGVTALGSTVALLGRSYWWALTLAAAAVAFAWAWVSRRNTSSNP